MRLRAHLFRGRALVGHLPLGVGARRRNADRELIERRKLGLRSQEEERLLTQETLSLRDL